MILLVTGGSASGKSEYAENRAEKVDLSGGNEAPWRGSSKKN